MRAFPDDFDPDLYKAKYPDLAKLDIEKLREHFLVFGRGEGRIALKPVQRNEFKTLFLSASSILEIGPFCNPVVTGPNTSYFDVLDAEGLRKRAEAIGYPIKAVPRIDFVEPNGDLSVVDRQFSAVFSAHCIEHQPDLIHHLQQVEKLVEDDGAYFLLIPDKRYCFDHFIPESTIANVVDAHIAGRRVHRLASVIEHRALTTHNDPRRHWRGDHADPGYAHRSAARVQAAIEEFRNVRGGYIDVHAWQFTPSNFRDICEQIFALGYTKLRPARVYDTPQGSNEFAAILEIAA